MNRIISFPPIAQKNAKILILGSMPGKASLDKQQYYAHPRNKFWPVICELFDQDSTELTYTEKCELLLSKNIALWDVLKCCTRQGSLDSAIKKEEPNNFEEFLTAHPDIIRIGLNGTKAYKSFHKLVWKKLSLEITSRIVLIQLPSTSPAYASLSFEKKRVIWAEKLLNN